MAAAGIRKMTALLRIEGRQISRKGVEQLCGVKKVFRFPGPRHQQRQRLCDRKHSVIRMRPWYPQHIWSVAFVHDRLIHGRACKMLTVIDACTRQCLAAAAQLKMTSQEVLATSSKLFIRCGKPKYIRSDNGSGFKAKTLPQWLWRVGAEPIYIYPGSPWENGYNEHFNSTLRNEVLDLEVFHSIQEARSVIKQWVPQDNHIRPHQASGYRPPAPETASDSPATRGT